ncbi:MAG TPA: bifunctional DNA-binding transcriptional regulator/O6-methylguanine-DNA methyltransferase Ada [Acidimicrobiales bacterium]
MSDLDDSRWLAVESRDATSSGVFLFAVRTTGVYCRPGCSSRRPLRKNVEYFVDADGASSAGYRACAKCRPDVQVLDDATSAAVVACRRLDQSQGRATLACVASEVGFSEGHLRRVFRDRVGVTFAHYARERRAEGAREKLRSGASVTDGVFDAGYRSASTYYNSGASTLGMIPSRYRNGGGGELIRYTDIETPLGSVVVARTLRGVCWVQLGPAVDELVARLSKEYPAASIERDDEGLRSEARAVGSAVRGESDPLSLPLDVAGSAFQVRVWKALRDIPAGETRTYTEVASAIGSPRAVRAVASACAANRLAVVVPCHRVIRSDGSLGGYRWGLEAKEALLAREARANP